jgi:Oxysterol-binding protein
LHFSCVRHSLTLCIVNDCSLHSVLSLPDKFKPSYCTLAFGNQLIPAQLYSRAIILVFFSLSAAGNHYTWRKVTTTVHNIIVGKLWVDQHGDMDIVNHKTGDKCHLKYIPYSYFTRDVQRKVRFYSIALKRMILIVFLNPGEGLCYGQERKCQVGGAGYLGQQN